MANTRPFSRNIDTTRSISPSCAKTLGGLLRRLAAKAVAYTCVQRINDSLGRPLRHLAELLI